MRTSPALRHPGGSLPTTANAYTTGPLLLLPPLMARWDHGARTWNHTQEAGVGALKAQTSETFNQDVKHTNVVLRVGQHRPSFEYIPSDRTSRYPGTLERGLMMACCAISRHQPITSRAVQLHTTFAPTLTAHPSGEKEDCGCRQALDTLTTC